MTRAIIAAWRKYKLGRPPEGWEFRDMLERMDKMRRQRWRTEAVREEADYLMFMLEGEYRDGLDAGLWTRA